jgi:Flp pilus assembly protein TadG
MTLIPCLRRRWTAFGGNACGAAAIEFALLMPVLAMILFGTIVFGSYLATAHGVQQIAAEAARGSIAGLTDDERRRLVESAVARSIGSYPFIEQARLTLARAALDSAGNTYSVELRYDASNMFIFRLGALAPAAPTQIVRAAAIQRGGY